MKRGYRFRKGLPLRPEDVRLTLEGMSEEEVREYEELIELAFPKYEVSSDVLMGGRNKMQLDIPVHR